MMRQLLVAAILLTGCMPDPPASDAGDPAFVRQVVPQLLGRQPVNAEETRFFNDVLRGRFSPAEGRRALLRGLMHSDEFAERSSEFLLRHGHVDRLSGVLKACFDQPHADVDASTLSSLTGTPSHLPASTPDFNGADVVKAAFAQSSDDLSTFMRVNLMTSNAGRDYTDNDSTVAARIQDTYLDRQLDCLGCHNSLYATTGQGSGWKRHYPMLGHFEKALYGAHAGPRNAAEVTNLFRTSASQRPYNCEVFGGACANTEQPWHHLSLTCGDFVGRDSVPLSPTDIRFGRLNARTGSIWHAEEMLRRGVDSMRGNWLRRDISPGDQFCNNCPMGQFNQIAADVCMSCHNPTRMDAYSRFALIQGTDPLDLQIQWRGEAPRRITTADAVRMHSAVEGGYMPPSYTGYTAEDRARIAAVLEPLTDPAAPPCSCDGTAVGRTVDPDQAFAFLTAANIVNSVWKEAFGRPLTLPNHFPRTSAASATLEFLTQRFVHEGWSLRKLLERIYLGKFVNRTGPSDRTDPEYVMQFDVPPVYDVWQQADRRVTPAPDAEGSNNAVTDAIRRRPVRTLLNSAHKALGWPAPKRFPDASVPSLALHRALTDDLSWVTPGSVDADVQNLLAWEEYAGACKKPAGVSEDFLDALVRAGVAEGASRESAVLALKDRLIGEGSIVNDDERAGLTAALGDLRSPVTTGDVERLRSVCGVLLTSPQFMLQGLTPTADRRPSTPSLLVCGAEGRCTYGAFCEAWQPAFERAGYSLSCPAELAPNAPMIPAEVRRRLGMLREEVSTLCTDGSCGFLPDQSAEKCASAGAACLPFGAMICDTRCAGMFCCGAALEDIDGVFAKGRTGLLYSVADESKVYSVSNVVRVRASGKLEKLSAGEVLMAGDILRFYQGAMLDAEGPYGRIATPKGGVKLGDKLKSLDLMVGRIDKLKVDEEEYYGTLEPMEGQMLEIIERRYTLPKEEQKQVAPQSQPTLPVREKVRLK